MRPWRPGRPAPDARRHKLGKPGSMFWLALAMRDPRVSLEAVDRLAAWAGARPDAGYGEIARAANEVER